MDGMEIPEVTQSREANSDQRAEHLLNAAVIQMEFKNGYTSKVGLL